MPVMRGIVIASEHEALILEVRDIEILKSPRSPLTPVYVFVG